MKKLIACLLVLLLLLAGCSPENNNSISEEKEVLPYQNISAAGVWLSFSEINSMLKSEAGFKAEFDKVIENCKALKIGEIYIHIRAYCDSLFRSDYFPLISAARDIDFDAFQYITDVCHTYGIKVHAWINPYRVLTSSSDKEALDPESPAYKCLSDENTENDKNICLYNGIYLNPAEPEVRELVINGIREVLNRYEVDGIHFDDYFYPTTDPEFDSASYEKYRAETENPLSLSDWRRANVNALISGCYTAVKLYGKDIVFSVSPMASIEKNYNELYADVKTWVESGCVDCIIPQLYFGFDYPDKGYRFDNLLDDWIKLSKANTEVELKIGLAPYKIGTDTQADSTEWNTSDDIIARQAEICYKNGSVSGFVLFSYSSLFSDKELNTKQREKLVNITNFYS